MWSLSKTLIFLELSAVFNGSEGSGLFSVLKPDFRFSWYMFLKPSIITWNELTAVSLATVAAGTVCTTLYCSGSRRRDGRPVLGCQRECGDLTAVYSLVVLT